MVMFGERANEDALQGRTGRPVRDFCYLVTTGQNFDRLSWPEAVREPRALGSGALGLFLAFLGAPVVFCGLFVGYAAVKLGARIWALAPINREEGARHVFVVFTAGGHWHRAEYVRGKGEIVVVLADDHGALPAVTGSHVMDTLLGADWGEQSTDDQPRKINRVVKTYRRRPSSWLPFQFYARTSVGFAAHVLGINKPSIRSPADLLDYCERDGLEAERVEAQLQVA